MFDAVFASPSVGSYSVEPLSVSEIDAHPDCDRIWATLAQAQGIMDRDIQVHEEESASACNDAEEDAADEQRDTDIDEIKRWAKTVEADFERKFAPPYGDGANWLLERLSEAEDAL